MYVLQHAFRIIQWILKLYKKGQNILELYRSYANMKHKATAWNQNFICKKIAADLAAILDIGNCYSFTNRVCICISPCIRVTK